jgi:hypothetical protein
MELTLRGDGPPSLQSWFDVQCFRLFGRHKHLAGKQFAGDANFKQGVMCLIQALDTGICARMKPRCTQKAKCHEWWWWLEVHCVPSATRVPCIRRSQNKVLGTQVFVTLFFLKSFVKGIHFNKTELEKQLISSLSAVRCLGYVFMLLMPFLIS